MPGGEPYLSLSGPDARAISSQTGLNLRQVEIAALDAGVIPERYVRNFKTWDIAGQRKLLSSCAALVGLGGLGGNVLEILARAGVGRISAADHDAFEESNLNRQILSEASTIDMAKAEAAALRVERINPAVEFGASRAFLDQPGMAQLVAGADLALDCLGGVESRNMLRRACADAAVPLVTAAVAGRTGFVALVMPGEPEPGLLFPDRAGAPSAELALGCPAPAVTLAAALQASLALDLLLSRRPMAPGQALYFDLADLDFLKIAP